MACSKTTKRALVASACATLMCIAMLIGTTFAWFTDTASTSVNKIQSGTLKVGLQMSSDGSTWTDAEGQTLNFKKATGATAGEAVLWEPGCTYELPALRVTNNGNLAFKYKIVVSGIDGDAKLLEAIDFTVKFNGEEVNLDNWEGILLPEGKTATAGTAEEVKESSSLVISGHMKEEAGNDYQNLSIDGISVTVYATQYTYEYDSYNNTYDLSSMYAFDDYVNVTKTVESEGATTITDGSTITATVPQGSLASGITELALIKKPTENPSSVQVETDESALTTDVKIINAATKETITAQGDTFFTIDIQLGQVDLQKFYHKGVELTKIDSNAAFTTAGQYKYNFTSGVVTFTTKDFSTFTAVFKFAGGDGTEDAPYLIATKGHFQGLNAEYSASDFNYYKIIDGVNTLDLRDVGDVNLYGEFDGNSATITTNQCLFKKVGIGNKEQTVSVIKKMTVMEDQSASAVVYTVGSKQLTFEDVKVSGSIERNYHGAAFVVYGTCNFDDVGWNYVLNFKNCSCNASIVTRAEGGVAILVGHAFQGNNNTLTINMDSATNSAIASAKLYGKATATGYKYYFIGSNYETGVDVYIDSQKSSSPHEKFDATSLGTTAPVKDGEGKYTVTADANVASVKVQVLSQLTAYDTEGNAIQNLNGITNTNGTCYSASVTGGSTVEVFGKVTSVVIEKGLTESGHPEYTLDENGKLTIKTNDTDNYLTGTIRLAAYQYNSDGALISSGTLDIAASTGTPAQGNVTWTVK